MLNDDSYRGLCTSMCAYFSANVKMFCRRNNVGPRGQTSAGINISRNIFRPRSAARKQFGKSTAAARVGLFFKTRKMS